jgi:hypothetical protein
MCGVGNEIINKQNKGNINMDVTLYGISHEGWIMN